MAFGFFFIFYFQSDCVVDDILHMNLNILVDYANMNSCAALIGLNMQLN